MPTPLAFPVTAHAYWAEWQERASRRARRRGLLMARSKGKVAEDSPASWWPRTQMSVAIDPQLPAPSQHALLDALRRRDTGRRARRAQQLLAALRGSYVDPVRDLDDEACRTWWRMTEAIIAAEDAAATPDAVDGIEARIVLGAQRWEIARELAAQTRLRQADAASGITRDRAAAAAQASTIGRVEAVEAYARQLAGLACAVHRRELSGTLDDGRLDALAAAEADALGVSQLGAMTARAGLLERALAGLAPAPGRSLLWRAVRRAGLVLSPAARPRS